MGIVAVVAGIYLAILVVLWSMQERITFPAPKAPLPDPREVLGYGERVELTMRDGTPLVGWYLPAVKNQLRRSGGQEPSAAVKTPAMLWFYGNGETIAAIWPIIRDFRPPHAALLVVDYPGYGASEGKASEAGMYDAANLAFDALRARPDVDPQRIYVYGRSLGSAAATHIAATREVAGLILESPFTSARAMAARHYKIFPRALVRLRLDNLERIKQIHCPTLIFHGNADMLVPIEMGKEVAAAAAGPVELVTIDGSGHNDTYDLGTSVYREKLRGFVR
ncbi:MAG TPA: alpha/beta hydrolase [Gemmatimonadales bacterium]|nr:alpha/beta hydrolase [Gemmatimonadales bacterium]